MSNRDRYVPKHKTPAPGVPVQTFDDVTAQHSTDPDRLRTERAKRPTDKRLARLEEKHDALDAKVDEIHGDVREMRGEMRAVLGLLPEKQKTERTRINARKAIIVAAIGGACSVLGYLLAGCL